MCTLDACAHMHICVSEYVCEDACVWEVQCIHEVIYVYSKQICVSLDAPCVVHYTYGVDTVSVIDKITGLFCRISSLL